MIIGQIIIEEDALILEHLHTLSQSLGVVMQLNIKEHLIAMEDSWQ